MPRVGGLIHVGVDAAAKRADLCLQPELAHIRHREAVFFAAGHSPGFDFVDAEIVERARDRNFGSAIEYDTGLLFAVA